MKLGGEMAIGLIVGLVVLVLILIVSATDKEELSRLQQLKNKRRFSGRKLPVEEAEELDRLLRKYWWC